MLYFGVEVRPEVGSYILPDGWSVGNQLVQGDSFSSFRLPTNSGGPIKSLACEIDITGRTPRKRYQDHYVRVKITFPGDCEPDTVTHGWMLLRTS